MKYKYLHKIFLLTAVIFMASVSICSAAINIDYLYNLSNFQGIMPFNWVSTFRDKSQDEVYVCNASDVSVFNSHGMEVYNFGDNSELGNVSSGAVDKDGNLLLLTDHLQNGKLTTDLMLCNYRGEPVSKVSLKGVPPEFSGFSPHEMVEHDGRFYIADLASMKVLVVDRTGKYLDGYNIANIMTLSDRKVRDSGMTGFNVDKDGNIFYTVAVNFRAYKLTPDRKLTSWGVPGSAPGKFGVVKGIATDDNGNIYVVDALRCMVIVFDKNFGFLTEFGGRGFYDGGLISPNEILVDEKGMVYVSQSANRGINVYHVSN